MDGVTTQLEAAQARIAELEDHIAGAGKVIALQRELIELMEVSAARADDRDDEQLAEIDRLKQERAALFRLGDALADALEHDTHGQDQRDQWVEYCTSRGLYGRVRQIMLRRAMAREDPQ